MWEVHSRFSTTISNPISNRKESFSPKTNSLVLPRISLFTLNKPTSSETHHLKQCILVQIVQKIEQVCMLYVPAKCGLPNPRPFPTNTLHARMLTEYRIQGGRHKKAHQRWTSDPSDGRWLNKTSSKEAKSVPIQLQWGCHGDGKMTNFPSPWHPHPVLSTKQLKNTHRQCYSPLISSRENNLNFGILHTQITKRLSTWTIPPQTR